MNVRKLTSVKFRPKKRENAKMSFRVVKLEYRKYLHKNRIYKKIKGQIQKRGSERLLRIYSSFRKTFLFVERI